MQRGTQEHFLLFLLSFSCLQQEQVWKRYAGSFLVTGQTTGSLIRCIMNLSERFKPYRRALNSLEKENRWKQEPSILRILRSNQFAEHAVEVMQSSKNHLAISSDVVPLGTASSRGRIFTASVSVSSPAASVMASDSNNLPRSCYCLEAPNPRFLPTRHYINKNNRLKCEQNSI